MNVLLRAFGVGLIVLASVIGTFEFDRAESGTAAPASPAPLGSAAGTLAAGSTDSGAPKEPTSEPTPPHILGGAPGPIKFADLAHATYTATGDLIAAFVEPVADYVSPTMASRFVVTTVRNAGVELSVNGNVVPTKQIGQRSIDNKTGETQYSYFGVMLNPGPNTITITPLGLNGLRGQSRSETVYGPGNPATFDISLSAPLVADGTTASQIVVAARDQWGHQAMSGANVRVDVVSGYGQLGGPQTAHSAAQADPLGASPAPGSAKSYVATLGDGGEARIPIVAGFVPGPLELRFYSGSIESQKTFYVRPFIRRAFVNGFVNIGAGSVPVGINGDGGYDGGGSRKHRGALFATGKVGRASSMTLAYESQNSLAALSSLGSFTENPDERPYLAYGDSSTRSSEFHSADHLYARLDSSRGHILWGEFNAQSGDSQGVGAFHELLSGAQVEQNIGNVRIGAFTARNSVAYASGLLPVSGLSALTQTLHTDIVVSSEYLSLVSLDRRTGAIVAQTPLIRNIDYSIDYAIGALRFINIPLPFDSHFNPQAILVQYQYSGGGVKSRTTGGNLAVALGHAGAAKLELSYINDVTGLADFSLFSQDLSGDLHGGHWIVSHAGSNGMLPASQGFAPVPPAGSGSAPGVIPPNRGDSYLFSLNEKMGANELALNYSSTSAGFGNPFGGATVGGLTNYRASLSHDMHGTGRLTLEMDGQQNRGLGVNNSQTGYSLSMQQALSRKLGFTFGVSSNSQRDAQSTVGPGLQPATTSGSVTQLNFGMLYHPNKRMNFSLQQATTVGGTGTDTNQSSQTALQLDYALGNRGKMYVRELMNGSRTSSFAESTASLTSAAGGTRQLDIGFQQKVGETSFNSDYVIDHTGNGADIYSAMGVQQQFKFGRDLGGNFFVQSASGGGNQGGFSVYGLTLNYARPSGLHTSFSYQGRGGGGGGSTLAFGMAGPLSPNLSIIGAVTRTVSAQASAMQAQVSMAYRSSASDKLISLLGFTHNNGLASAFVSDPSTIAGANDVLSFEELYRPWRGFEFAGRFAYKLSGDSFYQAHTSLLSLRARQDIGRRFDIGGEVRRMRLNIAAGDSTDFAAEAGYQLGGSTRLAAGYNFAQSANSGLTGQPQRRGIYVTVTTLVDRLFGWGKP